MTAECIADVLRQPYEMVQTLLTKDTASLTLAIEYCRKFGLSFSQLLTGSHDMSMKQMMSYVPTHVLLFEIEQLKE